MRTIKFRAWFKPLKRMFGVVEELKFQRDGSITIITNNTGGTAPNSYELMQFTGLKDKNGKEIYEGDILEWYYDSEKEHKKKLGSTFRAKVVSGNIVKEQGDEGYSSNHVGFFCEWLTDEGSEDMQFTDMPIENMCRIEVIGNIYENPELFEEKK